MAAYKRFHIDNLNPTLFELYIASKLSKPYIPICRIVKLVSF